MIRRHSEVPDNIFELRRHESIGDYARTYGDEITRRYEDLNIIYIPYFPMDLDLEFLRAVTFPPQFKKIGAVNGIEKNLFEREGSNFRFNEQHILRGVFPQPQVLGYLQEQIVSANWQLRLALRQLFPHYHSLNVGNITWRMTDTLNEGIHVDGFGGGKPQNPQAKNYHRVKLFVNIDSEPRKWWTSFTMPEILKRHRHEYPEMVGNDLDMLTYRTSREFLQAIPHHEIDIPPMGAVIGEASSISHAVRYGRRMVGAECHCLVSDMLDPGKSPHALLPTWLKDAGIGIDPNPKPVELSAAAQAYEAQNASPAA